MSEPLSHYTGLSTGSDSRKSNTLCDVAPQARYPTAWPLEKSCLETPYMKSQEESPLFGELSAELRLLVYKGVLTEPHRFLHICKNRPSAQRGTNSKRKVAHNWCTDMSSPYPTWQHACYGDARVIKPGSYSTFIQGPTTETNDQMLAILLTCRRVYSEALSTLYKDNIFHFRGSPSLIAFQSSVASIQWESIRHIHISTVYSYRTSRARRCWPPEDRLSWNECCQKLEMLHGLHSLKLDVVAKIVSGHTNATGKVDAILHNILGPLKSVTSKIFEVELNFEVSERVKQDLGKVPFTTSVRSRPLNTALYGNTPRLEMD